MVVEAGGEQRGKLEGLDWSRSVAEAAAMKPRPLVEMNCLTCHPTVLQGDTTTETVFEAVLPHE